MRPAMTGEITATSRGFGNGKSKLTVSSTAFHNASCSHLRPSMTFDSL